MTAQAPNPFPYEGPEYERPPVRRPQPAADYEPGDPIARAVLTIWLIIGITALLAAITRGTYTPHVILGCFAAAIGTAGVGALAYRFTDRKAVKP